MKMKGSVHKFKTLSEQNSWEFESRLKEGKRIEEIDRFESVRSRVKPYPRGIYRFKTMEEQQVDEFRRVLTEWEKWNKK